jgi:thiamine-phosphate pyrophosphorylase
MNKKSEDKIYRVIDVNFNRAREGLRVIEDTMRFIFEDEKFSNELRNLRHKLSNVIRKIYPNIIQSRDCENDFGKENREKRYRSIDNIVIANCKRVQESLRVLEEYSRLISTSANREFKNIRFKIYIFEKQYMREKIDD